MRPAQQGQEPGLTFLPVSNCDLNSTISTLYELARREKCKSALLQSSPEQQRENQIAFNDNMAISLMKLNLYFNWFPSIHVLTFCTKLASMHTVIGPVSDFLLSLYTYTNRNTTRLDKGKQFVNWIQLASNIFSSRNVFFLQNHKCEDFLSRLEEHCSLPVKRLTIATVAEMR